MPGGVLGLWGRVIDSDVSVHTLLHFMIRVFIAGLAGWEKLGVRLLLLFSAWAPTGAAGSNINVALHAQSNYAMHGWVAGSEITTRGLRRAFEALDRVQVCQVFAPFSYGGLSRRKWDLVIVEGYTGTVPAFIHEVRAANDKVVVLFFCLDTYPSLSVVGSLDIDAFLTNSRALLPSLRHIAPESSLVHLAADPAVMLKQPVNPRYEDNVVYLGQFKNTKHRLVQVVLSTTETLQRNLGMINNRVFEALSCGAAVVSDVFPALEETFGDHVIYYRQSGDAARAVQFLLGNDTARRELGRRGREMVSSKHTYASRVLSILATMKEVLHFNSQTSTAKAADIAQADTAVRALSGGVEPAAEVAGSKGSSGVWTMTPGAETFRPAVTVTTSSPQACSPTDRASAIAGNGTTSAVITMADCASRRPFCRPDEAVPIHAGLEQRSADHSSDRPPPSRVASTKQAQHPRGYPEDAGKHSNGGHLNGGSLDAPQVELAPGLSTSATRPNAPMVLVMYRSEFPPPRDWRGNIEAAAVTVSGGARISFMEIGEMVSEFSPADCTRGQGLKEEETCRREVLKARLSQLVAGETAEHSGEGHQGTSGVDTLGRSAATEALRYVEWCCSVGLVAVYAKVGDPLERQFLHHLAAEGDPRAVRTAFYTAFSSPSSEMGGVFPSLDQVPREQWIHRYEWAEYCIKDGPRRESPAAVTTSENAVKGIPSDGCGWDIPRLKTKIERVLFGMSRHATVSVLEPRDGALLAARQSVREGKKSDRARLTLRVKVEHPFFRAPADGMWCVALDGVEIGCRGDDDGDDSRSISSLGMTIEVDPRALPRRGELQAVLRGGSLEAAKVMTRSPPISVSIWVLQGIA